MPRCPRGCEEPVPLHRNEVDSLLAGGWYFRQYAEPFFGEDRERSDPFRPDDGNRRCQRECAEINFTGCACEQPGNVAFVRYMHHLQAVHAFQQLGREMVARTQSARAEVELAWAAF